MNYLKYLFLAPLILFTTMVGCEQESECSQPNCIYPNLSDYKFFKGELASLQPSEYVTPYELVNPLFSDYADKERFIYLPPGKHITYRKEGVLDFPEGSVLIKNFGYTISDGTYFWLETRLLMKLASGWEANAYIWNEEQTDSKLHKIGKKIDITVKLANDQNQVVHYLVPDKNQCKNCHSRNGEIELIGPKARNLNFNINGTNQLIQWQEEGLLEDLPDLSEVPFVGETNDTKHSLNDRARAYLDINCAHCHNSTGSARNTGLNLNLEQQNSDIGICKTPVSAGPGNGGLKFNIVPGNADSSIVVFRMKATDPDKRMPELGRTLVDEKGVELIAEWINAMPEDSCN